VHRKKTPLLEEPSALRHSVGKQGFNLAPISIRSRNPMGPATDVGHVFPGGMAWTDIPAGGVNPVAPPWLNSSVLSMYQCTLYCDTPKSCSSIPRCHRAAVCWYSPTPMRLPTRSLGCLMPESVL